ncbi:hypothetical protein F5B22DRAFT_296730 [Xylaria bambusicola]|uniref:uncharacterized protein n=1 Tax=Xylaria bambusicola TaxID=326684 RepID=UPI002008E5F3|nr:uncharacterized protein F5B22DRAFT_296730 [Xylaria bambusicola]KAI0512833.1 hypothetical protein F5B22DRAFT_296730 [Xylaria bambusicola]
MPQNTFSIIPDIPSALNANRNGGPDDAASARPSRPPMTTKQVKKAYKQANKGPKLSKAEQRRQELFEQDRIRKEFEKEKHQARARAAREKKKEKEERERAEKKKKGLPLVDVRASQDTIARFVRSKPKSQREPSTGLFLAEEECQIDMEYRSLSPKAHDSSRLGLAGELNEIDKENIDPRAELKKGSPTMQSALMENDFVVDEEPPICDYSEPQKKKRKIEVSKEQEEDLSAPFPTTNGIASPKPDHKVSIANDQVKGTPDPNAQHRELNLGDSFSTVDFDEEDLFDDFFRKPESVHSPANASTKSMSSQKQSQHPQTESPPPKAHDNGTHLSSLQKTEKASCPDFIGGPANPLSSSRQEAHSASPRSAVKAPYHASNPDQNNRVLTPSPAIKPPVASIPTPQPVASSSRSFRQPRTPMGPLMGPPKFQPSKPISSHQPKPPQFLKPPLPSPRTPFGGPCRSRVTKPEQVLEEPPPPSTQLFVLNHLDDFLPSPSQEMREIFDEPKKEYSKNGSIQAPWMTTHTGHKVSEPKPRVSQVPPISYNRPMISKPAISPGRSLLTQPVANRHEHQGASSHQSIQPIHSNLKNTFDVPFFSTQDVLLSSQDVKDIEEDPLPPPKTPAITPTPQRDDPKPPESPRRSPKPLFTSSFREMRYKFVLERAKSARWEGPAARQKAREALDKLQAEEDARLEALLANPDGEGEGEQTKGVATESAANKPESSRKSSPDTLPRLKPTPQAPSSHPAEFDSASKSARNSLPTSGSVPDRAVRNPTRKFPDAQPSRLRSSGNGGGSSRTTQRPTSRPKSSYEAMLEALAAKESVPPPPIDQQKQKQKKQLSSAHLTEEQKRGGDAVVQLERMSEDKQIPFSENNAATTMKTGMIMITASQETDYDGGEEWDDDDLLRNVML